MHCMESIHFILAAEPQLAPILDYFYIMGSSQDLGPIVIPLNIRRRNITYNKKRGSEFENNPYTTIRGEVG